MIWLGGSFVTTNPVLIKAAWDIDPACWDRHVEGVILSRFSSIHLSNSNRFFPGFGGLDFGRIISVLDALGYRGRLAVEGNVKASFAEDASRAAEYLRPRLRSD